MKSSSVGVKRYVFPPCLPWQGCIQVLCVSSSAKKNLGQSLMVGQLCGSGAWEVRVGESGEGRAGITVISRLKQVEGVT